MDNHKINNYDEVDLKEVLLTLWHGKIYIILVALVSFFLASLYLQSAERKFTVEYNLKPVGETKNTSPLSGFSGIASFAGIQLPASSNNDFIIFKKLITAVEVSEIIFENQKIVKNIYKHEWSESLNKYLKPPQSKIQILKSDIKKLLTGNKAVNYIPPNPTRLADFIAKNVQIYEDKETGFLRFVSETSQPELILSVLIEATKTADGIMRQRYVNFSKEPLAFYKDKLRTARSREHRDALAALIGKEEQNLMFASQGKYFIAEPYLNPTITSHPTSPKPKLILALSLLIGLFIGITFILTLRSITKAN